MENEGKIRQATRISLHTYEENNTLEIRKGIKIKGLTDIQGFKLNN